jgi:hypothetical protein
MEVSELIQKLKDAPSGAYVYVAPLNTGGAQLIYAPTENWDDEVVLIEAN